MADQPEPKKDKKEDKPRIASEEVQAAIHESVDSWRATQGLPPIDRSKKE